MNDPTTQPTTQTQSYQLQYYYKIKDDPGFRYKRQAYGRDYWAMNGPRINAEKREKRLAGTLPPPKQRIVAHQPLTPPVVTNGNPFMVSFC